MVEAEFIALRRTFCKHEPYEAAAHHRFRTPSRRSGLNSTPGTEDNAALVDGMLNYLTGLRPSLKTLRSHLLNEISGETGGLPEASIVLQENGREGMLRWHLPSMDGYIFIADEDAALFKVRKGTEKDFTIKLKVEFVPGFVAIDQLTSDEADEIDGPKVSFNIKKKDPEMGDRIPLRS